MMQTGDDATIIQVVEMIGNDAVVLGSIPVTDKGTYRISFKPTGSSVKPSGLSGEKGKHYENIITTLGKELYYNGNCILAEKYKRPQEPLEVQYLPGNFDNYSGGSVYFKNESSQFALDKEVDACNKSTGSINQTTIQAK